MIGSVVLTSGQNSINNNFGELLPSSICGTVYVDANGTGQMTSGDTGAGGSRRAGPARTTRGQSHP